MSKNNGPIEAVREIRRLAADWLEASRDANAPVARILRLLETVEQGLNERAKVVATNKETRGRTPARYTVDRTAAGEVLTEWRPDSGASPFRVPKAAYEAVTEVLANNKEPLRFEEIVALMSKRDAVPPADFQIRTCLRFWLATEPPLITRSRSAYHPVSRFSSAAALAWKKLAESGS